MINRTPIVRTPKTRGFLSFRNLCFFLYLKNSKGYFNFFSHDYFSLKKCYPKNDNSNEQ